MTKTNEHIAALKQLRESVRAERRNLVSKLATQPGDPLQFKMVLCNLQEMLDAIERALVDEGRLDPPGPVFGVYGS